MRLTREREKEGVKDRRREFDEVEERWRETVGEKPPEGTGSDGVELERGRDKWLK